MIARALLCLMLATVPGLAVAGECRLSASAVPPAIATPDGPARAMPIASLILAMTWVGGFCANHGRDPAARGTCTGHAGRAGFVLHGLWPDGAPVDGHATWPQWCAAPAGQSWQVPAAVVRAMACTTPSPDLLAHEWAKHGTCMAPSPAAYFARARTAFAKVRFPAMAALAARPGVTAGDVRRAFAAADPRYPVAAIDLLLRDGHVQEVHLCHDPQLKPAACPVPGPADSQPVTLDPDPRV